MPNRNSTPKTMSECLFFIADPKVRDQLEDYRQKYEAIYGETDLTKRYTSTWPDEHQSWLKQHHLKAYFDGLPPFVKGFLKGKAETKLRNGTSDDLPDDIIELYMNGEMVLDHEHRGRGR